MIENQIEFNKVKEMWASLATTKEAKDRIKDKWIILDESTLRAELRNTSEAKEMIEKLGNPPLQDVSEILEILDIASKGECLTPYRLERVQSILTVLERLSSYLGRGKQYNNSLAYYDETLSTHEELKAEIVRQIRAEQVDSHASKELFDIRMKIEQLENEMIQKAESVIRTNGNYMADNFHTTRNGRICVPVKKEYRYKVQGNVIDKSSTGNTLFVEPEGVSRLSEKLQLLKIDEENEVFRILYTLTAMVSDCAKELTDNMHLIEKLDYFFSKGKLSIELDATEPSINLDRQIKLSDARHPLMDRETDVPLTFELGSTYRGVVITGPNTGGKTVAIKTVMLNLVMAQCGLHVCCKNADVCMNSGYFCDIGDGQNISDNLSTFSSHIKNVLSILKEIDENSFVIMDELGSGTDPQEGMVIGEAGESCAFYIADRLGMPSDMLNTAVRAAYGKEALDLYSFTNEGLIKSKSTGKIRRTKKNHKKYDISDMYKIGDSVIVYPEKKIGIVCEEINEKGVLRVQIAGKKIWINHKRVKLYVKAEELYPEDYDMSIVFDSVENRKVRHDMGRKYTTETIEY